jgi:GNAT superfamily N-acetyltransferase
MVTDGESRRTARLRYKLEVERSVKVRSLQPADHAIWQALWDGYLAFYRAALGAELSDITFRRLSGEEDGMFGLLAIDGGAAIGLAHVVTHRSTWSAGRCAYLEDLFVAPAARGTGAGQLLIEAVYARADALGADRVYWHTQEYNGAARSLYDQVGHRTSFVVYERNQ